MIVLIITLSIISGVSIGFPIGKYKTECEFGKILYLLEKGGQLKLKEVKCNEEDS